MAGMTASVTPSAGGAPGSIGGKLSALAGDIKLAHTVFALPFALLSTFLAAGGLPAVGVLGLILVCMVTARTVAMAANRLLDAEIDARNPRTARRAIPAGRLSRGFYWGVLVACCLLFVACCGGFWWAYGNRWPVVCSAPVLGFLCGYPLMKRFTRLCHYYLGGALALAPVCAWVAVRGEVGWPAMAIAAAVLCWTAGFDILYACQDYGTDVAEGLYSVPAKVGVRKALWVARGTHVAAAGLLVSVGFTSPLLGPIYFVGAGIACMLLIYEHSLVRADDLSKINVAFFTLNGIISCVVGTLGIVDVFVR